MIMILMDRNRMAMMMDDPGRIWLVPHSKNAVVASAVITVIPVISTSNVAMSRNVADDEAAFWADFH